MKLIYITLSLLFLSIVTSGQSIRKNYNEMTALERNNLVNAFYQLRTGPDLINDLAVFHGAYFDLDNSSTPTALDIHFNLPDEPEQDIFLAWHRRQIFEVEQAMQDINPYISIPFWNSSVDQSTTSPLWDQNFLGQFNTDWDLQRNLGGMDMLPFPSDVTQAQSQTDWYLYSDMLERGPVHHGAHRWVGGIMNANVSPRDPVFYLHHAWIDKLWREWQDAHQSSTYMRTNMLRYDGTYVFNGQTLPVVNPNSIINARSLGTFYGENQLAIMDNYTVSNTYNAQELFFYQYVIQVQNNFNVPAQRNARIESVTRIRLLPGFHAFNGSNFVATIGDGTTGQREFPAIVRNTIPWDNRGIPIDWDAYRPKELEESVIEGNIHIYPNPFTDRLTLISKEPYDTWFVEIYDLTGRKLFEKESGHASTVVYQLDQLNKGTYVIKMTLNGNVIKSSTIIKQ
ncbi:MAG TPA: tyrosinase family protein [Lentimicrobium sp.]|nr:tyrosinase family protein [Lentimicrobium sp.]